MPHPHIKYFQDYVHGDFEHVYLGDDEPCKIDGKGKVELSLKNGNKWLLKELSHIHALRINLISTGKLGSEGFIYSFIEKSWKVTKRSLVIKK